MLRHIILLCHWLQNCNWVTADGCVVRSHASPNPSAVVANSCTHRRRRRDATRQNSFVSSASAVCIGLYMWQCIIACDSVLLHVTVYYYMWQCIITCDSVLLHVTVCYYMWQCVITCNSVLLHVTVCYYMWQCVITCDSVLLHVTVYYYMWPCIITRDSVLLHVTVYYYTWQCICYMWQCICYCCVWQWEENVGSGAASETGRGGKTTTDPAGGELHSDNSPTRGVN